MEVLIKSKELNIVRGGGELDKSASRGIEQFFPLASWLLVTASRLEESWDPGGGWIE